jgi:hypothetical protein
VWRVLDESGSMIPAAHRTPGLHGATRTRSRARRREIAAAIGVVLAGAAVVAGIVSVDPRWQAIIATIPAPWSATARLGARGLVGGMPARELAVEPGSALSPGVLESPAEGSALSAGLPSAPRAPNVSRSKDFTRSAAPTPGVYSDDAAQVMVSMLLAQLGPDPAWQTALANAEAHSPGSPEFSFWYRVAAAIRESAAHMRP